jgi:polyisoprenoid-binding protein YceI
MKRTILLSGILALAAHFGAAQTSTWTSDTAHSEVGFTISHMTLSNVHGRFGHVNATIQLNETEIAKSTVTATIDVAGIDTGESGRDAHLKTPDFFDTAQFATATFTSTGAHKAGGNLLIDGNLTLHGVTKPVTLTVSGPVGPIQSPMDKKLHAGFSATATISRSAFGIGAKFPAAMVGDEVKLDIELEVFKQ